jgi:hypothetical protein
MPVASNTNVLPISAAAAKERRAQDAAQAMREHEVKRVAVLAKTARLRAARLAKEAEAEAAAAAPKKTRSPKQAK